MTDTARATSLNRRIIAPGAALEIVQTALTEARAQGLEVAVAVTDPFGTLTAFGKTDGALASVGGFAQDKAYTAGLQGKSTKAFGERMASSPSLSMGLASRERFLVWGGGVAIYEEDLCIGGLGISGAQDHEDIAIAETALHALGLEAR
jgi:uncharacterized protein GlcG (DUF336 family)